MISGPQTKTAVLGAHRYVREEARDDADVAEPVAASAVDDGLEAAVEASAPSLEVFAVEELRRRAGAAEDCHAPVVRAVREHMENCRPERCDAEPAGDDEQIAPLHLLEGPPRAVRPAHPELVAFAERFHGARHRPDGAHRMDETCGLGRVAADGDGHLACAVDVEHVELTRDGTRIRPARRR